MQRGALRLLIGRIGERAGAKRAHPHRWWHTFAVIALVNGMDAFTLQTSVGHSTMDMVRRYLNVAQRDTGRIQRKASPVGNLAS
jgi:integrase/recombinase XerD